MKKQYIGFVRDHSGSMASVAQSTWHRETSAIGKSSSSPPRLTVICQSGRRSCIGRTQADNE
jgi:hypothetical protein